MIKRNISIKNIFFLILIALLIIPQTRQQIQIALHTMIAKINPSLEKEDAVAKISSYNWKLKDLEGNSVDLNQVKGKVVFVNMWATWCPPCIAEMPSIQKLYNDYKDKIEFVLVSNEKQATIKSFLEKKNYNFNTFIPQTQIPQTFNVKSIPRTFLIDKEGNIIIDESGAANWNSQMVRNTIDKLLKD
ncbi:thiol-disulfide isomerase/thioredoxin [Lacinutrix venerupis]|uniref:Thiol-disulfide oxidoreductase n=1 Tax=Lacinutrix venerupis TaxID=1486034 RepID=A0AAC9LM26_9FLAO|nr:TlpA disulfide reductase family protein [Lacinutrix venerupis]APY00599.1 thiol-disulfide oxidoreductase [Lacinutrix venerupis]RLJ64241.1 thiol-disulfide isomerase/thioredoxin [Lacinutrix venerupis]